MSDTKTLHDKLEEDGFVVVDGLVPFDLLESLRAACDRVIEKARSGTWIERRTVGKQFPPWPRDHDPRAIWAVQHVMHPQLAEPIFAQWYGSAKLIQTVAEILQVQPNQLQFELFNLLINPSENPWSITWHRDSIMVDVSEEEENRKLKIPHSGTQWNTALYDDASFIFVPRSHYRIRTPEERRVNQFEPYGVMPGEVTLNLKAGQTVFYINNLLHRAKYDNMVKRATLHASMGMITAGPERAQNLLQHGLADWIRSNEFKETLPADVHPLYDNLLRMAEKNKDVGYDHVNDGFSKEVIHTKTNE